jgi:hypothetical protein
MLGDDHLPGKREKYDFEQDGEEHDRDPIIPEDKEEEIKNNQDDPGNKTPEAEV